MIFPPFVSRHVIGGFNYYNKTDNKLNMCAYHTQINILMKKYCMFSEVLVLFMKF